SPPMADRSVHRSALFSFRRQPAPSLTLLPYTTLFRSSNAINHGSLANGIGSDDAVRLAEERFFKTPEERGRLAHHLNRVQHSERSEEHTSELQSRENLVCRLLLEIKKIILSTTQTRDI